MENSCVFCLEKNGILVPNIYCRCNYHYHTDCVDRWLAQNNKCVMCSEKMVSRMPSPIQERQNATMNNDYAFTIPSYNTVIAVPPPPLTYSYPPQQSQPQEYSQPQLYEPQPQPQPQEYSQPQLYEPQPQSQPQPQPQLLNIETNEVSTGNTPYTTVSSPSNIQVVFHTPQNDQVITNIQHRQIRDVTCRRRIFNIFCGSLIIGTIGIFGVVLFDLLK